MKNMIGNIDILVKELCKLPKEVGWVEFKHNNCEPNMAQLQISVAYFCSIGLYFLV